MAEKSLVNDDADIAVVGVVLPDVVDVDDDDFFELPHPDSNPAANSTDIPPAQPTFKRFTFPPVQAPLLGCFRSS
jgi:hypothetical protein